MQSHRFHDFDAFAASVRGVDCGMMLRNAKRHAWTIDDALVDGIRVQVGSLGSGNIVEGQSYPDHYLLYMPLNTDCEYSANGDVIAKDAFAILEPGCEFCVSTRTEHDWCSAIIPADMFAGMTEPSPGSDKAECRVTQPNSQLATQFRHAVHNVVTSAATCPEFETAAAARVAALALMNNASTIIGLNPAGAVHRDGRPKLSRKQIIQRCRELLDVRSGKPVLVSELTAAADVSERTLRSAFHEFYGIGPARFLQLRQIHQAHRALKAADPDAKSVTEVMTELGVWEFGRFASRYRSVFGEYPSATLRRAR